MTYAVEDRAQFAYVALSGTAALTEDLKTSIHPEPYGLVPAAAVGQRTAGSQTKPGVTPDLTGPKHLFLNNGT